MTLFNVKHKTSVEDKVLLKRVKQRGRREAVGGWGEIVRLIRDIVEALGVKRYLVFKC